MKLSDVQIKDLITIVNETIELLNILKGKIDLGYIKDEKILNSYRTLYELISLLDSVHDELDSEKDEQYEYNEILIRISNEVRLLLKILRNMTFKITDNHLINQYYKLFELLRWWDFILHYWDECKTLPPKYDYKPNQEVIGKY